MHFSDIVYETNIEDTTAYPLCNQMNAVLKHIGLPRSRCFQVENTDSKLGENVGTTQIMELLIVNWTIIMCTFWIFAHTFGYGA